MTRRLEDIFPIMDIEHDCIVSKTGDITVGFEVHLPEIFTQSNEEYEVLHQAWIKAIKVLPKYSILHKQDWFLEAKYKPANSGVPKTFLVECSDRHFANRPFLDHYCHLFLTKRPNDKKMGNSASSSLLRKSIIPELLLNPQARRDFTDACGQFKSILQEAGGVRMTRLTNKDLASSAKRAGIVERYFYLMQSEEESMIREHIFDDEIQIGEFHCQLYTLSDIENLPTLCGSRINYEKYSTDQTKFPVGFASHLGLLLPVNHVYNQYIFINNSSETIKKLESKRTRLHSLSAYSRENAISEESVNAFLNEAVAEQRTPIKAHFNVFVWSPSRDKLKEVKNLVSTALAQMEATPKIESDGAAQIWWAGLPGNEAQFPENDSFDTFIEQACCFFSQETNYSSDPPESGIRFADRLSAKPVFVDLFDLPRTRAQSSNMGTLCAGTSGGGKSMTVNHILRSLFDQGAHCVTIDIGGSYKSLCKLVKGYYFTYTEDNPIRLNPFFIPKGEVLDTEKKESLKALLVSLWKQENESFNRSEYVALSNALQGYFDMLKHKTSIFPCFNTFYEYLETLYVQVLKNHKVKDKDFDIDNFLYVLRPYYKNGEFDYLLNASENLDLLNQPFIVFELDNIKDHAILFPVVTLIIMENFISKMRKLAGKRKVLTIDEAWKAIAKAGMAEFVKYAYKTIRKFNGVPIVVTQELDDLISSPIIKDAIIANSDIKILMDMRKFINKFDKLQATLGLSEKSKTILLSVNKDNREIFIDIGGQVTKVYKNELCPEERYAFTTEGVERIKVMEYAERYGSVEEGIKALIADSQNKK